MVGKQPQLRYSILLVFLLACSRLPFCALGWSPLHPPRSLSESRSDTRRTVLVNGLLVATGMLVSPNANAAAIDWEWSDVPKGGFPVLVDGQERNAVGQKGPASVKLHYNDNAPSSSARRITVYQRTGTASVQRLKDAASKLGVPRALDIGDRIGSDLAGLKTARLVAEGVYGGDGGPLCYTFDMVSEDDAIRYMVSSTVVKERLYVFVLETSVKAFEESSTAKQLQAIRDSFVVEPL